jgi:MarR family transcriptional regulator, organic hydroperoxide resistance regulator
MRTARELRFLILALQREGNRHFAAGLRPLGLTPAQAEVLSVLAEYQPLTLGGLGELLICESGTSPSRLVDRLVSAGLVRRETAAHDRRHVRLSLTAEGRQLAKRVTAVEDELEATLDNLIAGKPTAPALTLLRALADPLPAGQALKRRRDHGRHARQ